MQRRNGAHRSSTPGLNLPVVSFRKVTDEPVQLAGVHEQQARNYGYNDPNHEFKRPEAYIRYTEPLESELLNQVEYDMDEQDQEWLDALNSERRKEQSNQISYETFEIIIDRIEKEWFTLTKRLPKSEALGPSEDSTCAICDDAEVENSNAIVFCDGCNLAVHQECYGVPYIPEGQWLCRKCQISPEQPVSCVLCPNEGGAFKQTSTGSWAHLLCAMYIAETSLGNSVIQEPVEGIERIEKARWKLVCSICNNGAGHGACIQCAKTLCYTAYHVTCARKYKLLMPMKGAEGEKLQLTSYCSKHVPEPQASAHLEVIQAEANAINDFSDQENEASPTARKDRTMAANGGGALDTPKSKSARAYAKSYTLGAPLVPAIIVDRVMAYISKLSVNKKLAFIQLACRYWSLKREARRGAPLLKRLYLEPWSGAAVDQKMSEAERAVRLKYTQTLRADLETVRLITDVAKKRESQKLKQAHIVQDLFSALLYPHESALRVAFERIVALDRFDVFKSPVSKFEVPDYFDIVTSPMCWNQIDEKLDRHEYWDIDSLRADVQLVLDNAILYNKKDTTIYRLATRMKPQSDNILNQLTHLRKPSATPDVGELEPAIEMLELFFSQQDIAEDLPHILNDEPITSLFTYEFEELKPVPPKPKIQKAPKRPKKGKVVRDYAAEKARRKALGEEESPANASISPIIVAEGTPEFRPRTRGERAKHAAFAAEAGVEDQTTVVLPPESPSRRRQKRDPLVLPGQSSEPPVVESVDNQQSFKMFDAGWILPSSAKRGGRIAMEKLDGPPPRKRQRTAGAPVSKDSVSLPTSIPKPEPGSSSVNQTARYPILDDESDLSELSELTDDEEDAAKLDPEAEAVAHLHIKPGERLENGTLVWAKMEGFPSWPAAVWDEDVKQVPKKIIKNKPNVVRKEPGPLHLVQFYDKNSSWRWVEPSKLHLLGEDEEFDAAMVTGKSNLQRFKTNQSRNDCRAAFRRAKAVMETVEDLAELHEEEEASEAVVKVEKSEPEIPAVAALQEPEAVPGLIVQMQVPPESPPALPHAPPPAPATFTFVHVNPAGYNLR